MTNKIPKLSANLYLKLAQALSNDENRFVKIITLTEEEKKLNARYYEAFMSGQGEADQEEQDKGNAA
jgi:hypothetical protein